VDWQGKPKFSEKTCPSATFVHHKIPHDQTQVWTRAASVGSRRLTAWAMARPYWLTKYIPLSFNHQLENPNTRQPYPPILIGYDAEAVHILLTSWTPIVPKRINTISTFFCKTFLNLTQLYAESEVLEALVMKGTIFWDITPCDPLKVNRRFGGAYHFHIQGEISRARYQRESRRHSDYCHSTRVFRIGVTVFRFILRLRMYIACSLKKTLENKEFRFLSGSGYLK
jgi:hypothetical protein